MSTELPEQAGSSDAQHWQIVYVGNETVRPADYIGDGPPPIDEGAVIELAPGLGGDFPGSLNEFDDMRCWEVCTPDKIVISLPDRTIEIPIKLCRQVCGIPRH